MNLIEMSRQSCMLILVIILIRALAMHHLPKKIFTLLWSIALLRLLLPIRITSPFSIYTILTRKITTAGTVDLVAASANASLAAGAPSSIQEYGLNFSVGSIIWTTGFVVCALFFLFSYFYSSKKFMTSLPVDDEDITLWLKKYHSMRQIQVRESDRVTVPLTYGIIHPVILLPRKMDRKNKLELHYVLMHEYIHIRHFDAIWKLFLAAALCLHWFNPLVWIMYILFNRDMEHSCDESVIHSLGIFTKSGYALTLVHLEEKKNRFLTLYSSFSKNSIEERITAIMKTKTKSIPTLVCGLFLAATITTVFATSNSANAKSTDTEAIYETMDTEAVPGSTEMEDTTIVNIYNPNLYTIETDWTKVEKDAKSQGKSDEWIKVYISELKKSYNKTMLPKDYKKQDVPVLIYVPDISNNEADKQPIQGYLEGDTLYTTLD